MLLLLLLVAAANGSSMGEDDRMHFPGREHNMLDIKIEVDPTQCDVELNHQSLHSYLDAKFQNVTGIAVTVDDDTDSPIKFQLSISLKGREGLHETLLTDNYDGIKHHIVAHAPCTPSGVNVKNIQSMFSEIVPGRTTGNDKHHMMDHLQSILGGTRRNLAEEIQIPNSKTYKNKISEARDQGQIGSCASFSMDTLFQYYGQRDQKISQKWSTKFFYYNRCLTEENNFKEPCGEGMYIEDNGDLTKKVGTVSEETYPYKHMSEHDFTNVIPDSVKEQAKNEIPFYKNDKWICFEGEDFSSLDDFTLATKAYLAMYGPIQFATHVYSPTSACDIWNSKSTDADMLGGHAMSITGYDASGLEIRNSWGTSWCNDGYSHMTWEEAYKKIFTMCVWEKPENSEFEFCYDDETWKDQIGKTCQDYGSKGWCANCGDGPHWADAWRAGTAMEWVGSHCDKSCGCCTGVSYKAVVLDTSCNSSDGDCCSHEDCTNTQYCYDTGYYHNGEWNGIGSCSSHPRDCCADKDHDPIDQDPSKCPAQSNCHESSSVSRDEYSESGSGSGHINGTDSNDDGSDSGSGDLGSGAGDEFGSYGSMWGSDNMDNCGEDDDSSFFRLWSFRDCYQLADYCSIPSVSDRCQATCCGEMAIGESTCQKSDVAHLLGRLVFKHKDCAHLATHLENEDAQKIEAEACGCLQHVPQSHVNEDWECEIHYEGHTFTPKDAWNMCHSEEEQVGANTCTGREIARMLGGLVFRHPDCTIVATDLENGNIDQLERDACSCFKKVPSSTVNENWDCEMKVGKNTFNPMTKWAQCQNTNQQRNMPVGSSLLTEADNGSRFSYTACAGFFGLGLVVAYAAVKCTKKKHSDSYFALLDENIENEI